jgi:hypothetical protein
LVRSDNSEAAWWWLVTAGKVAISVDQSNEEVAVEQCEGEVKWVVDSSGDVQAQG